MLEWRFVVSLSCGPRQLTPLLLPRLESQQVVSKLWFDLVGEREWIMCWILL